MKRLAGLSNAIVLVAICVHPALGNAQNSSETVPVACPQASEVTALHLYGAWQARWEGVREAATLPTTSPPFRMSKVLSWAWAHPPASPVSNAAHQEERAMIGKEGHIVGESRLNLSAIQPITAQGLK